MSILTLLGYKKNLNTPQITFNVLFIFINYQNPSHPPLLNKTLTNEITNMLIDKNYFWRMKHEIDVLEWGKTSYSWLF